MDIILAYLEAERRIIALFDKCILCRHSIADFHPHDHMNLTAILKDGNIDMEKVATAFNALANREVYCVDNGKFRIRLRCEGWEKRMPEAVRTAMGLQLVAGKAATG